MAYIPEAVRAQAKVPSLAEYFISEGKVGIKYQYPSQNHLLGSVRSDRLSVFDLVLPILVREKGAVLTALTRFFSLEIMAKNDIKYHLAGSMKNMGKNMAKDLKATHPDVDLTRTLVIHKCNIEPYEMIFRAYLGGSVWKKYQETGIVAGVQLPAGMQKWQKLDELLFTPSTKAEAGHDVNITQAEYFAQTGEVGHEAVAILSKIYESAFSYAASRGIVLMDTKFEYAYRGERVWICDEWLTPDSSRYVSAENLADALANNREPDFLDKQPVRDYCAKIETPFKDADGKQIIGYKDLDPMNFEHVAFVSENLLPQSVADETTDRYLDICKRLTGMTLAQCQKELLF